MDTTATQHVHADQSHRESADGTPFLSYYDRERVIAFTWSGMPGHPIEVCREPGEPVLWRVTVNALDFQREAREARENVADGVYDLLPATYVAPHLFGAVCDRWLTERYDATDGEPETWEPAAEPRTHATVADEARCWRAGEHQVTQRHPRRDCPVAARNDLLNAAHAGVER